jgi:hypothetical protein
MGPNEGFGNRGVCCTALCLENMAPSPKRALALAFRPYKLLMLTNEKVTGFFCLRLCGNVLHIDPQRAFS